MPEDTLASLLLELAVQGRPEAVTERLLGNEAEDVRKEAGKVADTLASLALALPDVPPSTALKDRILKSLSARRPSRTAVLVVDMLNDHLTPGSSVEVPRARDIVPALTKRLDQARTAGIPVVYVVDQHEPDDPDLDSWTTHNVAGTKGGEIWPDLAAKPGDKVVTKPTYSGFAGSRLAEVLDDLKVDTLILTGCLTEIGLMATAADALTRGYAVEVPPDAQAGASELAEKATLAALSMMPPYGAARRALLKRLDTAA